MFLSILNTPDRKKVFISFYNFTEARTMHKLIFFRKRKGTKKQTIFKQKTGISS